MNKTRTYWILLIVALVLMIGGSALAAWINTGAGAATIQDVTIFGTNGYTISAYLYTPRTATAQQPAPAILMFHGLDNQKDYMANTALEMARRGFVVLNADMTGHGFSNGANGENGYGGPDALAYLYSLAIVDKKNIGLLGMSQGGFGAVTAAAHAHPDEYSSIFYMESECTPPGAPVLSLCDGLKNVAFNEGQVTELGVMIMVAKGSEAPVSPVLQPVFGITEPIQPEKVYGSIVDGTARILYQPFEDHAGSTDSPAAIGNAIDWMQMTLEGETAMSPSDQIWGWKLFGTAAALLGSMLFLFPMGALLLQTTYFKPLLEKTPEYKGFSGIGWWIGALITTAIGPLLYVWVWQNMFFTAWVPPSNLWPQTFTNIYMVWAAIVGAIAVVLILVNHYVFTGRRGATAAHYGLTSETNAMDWPKIGKSLLLAVCILVPLYALLAYIDGVLRVDFRAWVVALMPMSLPRFWAFLGYLLPFAIYFVPQGILFAGFLRARGGKSSLGLEMAANALMLTVGVAVWLLIMYVPILQGGVTPFGTGPLGPSAAGLGAIYYIPLIVLWPLVAFLYTYFFRKTGRAYAGIFLVTLYMVWYLAAFGDFAVWR
jgi:hypothetical protein